MATPTYLSPAQLHARWNGIYKLRTIYSWKQNGLGPKRQKLGSRVVYELQDVLTFEAASYSRVEPANGGGQ
jgi:hypothetical protein